MIRYAATLAMATLPETALARQDDTMGEISALIDAWSRIWEFFRLSKSLSRMRREICQENKIS